MNEGTHDASTEKDDGRSDDDGSQPDESKKERIDRELTELLNELRVALPGVQVLFAFLLTVPFSQGFTKMSGTEKQIYAAALLLAAAATASLIAPTSNHRLNFREGDKERIVKISNRLAIGGLLALMLSMVTAVYLVMRIVFGSGVGSALAIGTVVWFGTLWYVLPLTLRLRR